MSTGPKKKENRGGKRPGAGRPAGSRAAENTLTQGQIAAMLATAKRMARIQGKTIDDILLELIYSPDSKPREVLAGIKLFKEFTIAKISEGGHTDTAGPSVYLPDQRPQLKAIDGGKKVEAGKSE